MCIRRTWKHTVLYFIIMIFILCVGTLFGKLMNIKYDIEMKESGHYHFIYFAENFDKPLDFDGVTWGAKEDGDFYKVTSDPFNIESPENVDPNLTDIDAYMVYLNYSSSDDLLSKIKKIKSEHPKFKFNETVIKLDISKSELSSVQLVYVVLLVIILTLIIYATIFYELKKQSKWLLQYKSICFTRWKLIRLSYSMYGIPAFCGIVLAIIFYKLIESIAHLNLFGSVFLYFLVVIIIFNIIYLFSLLKKIERKKAKIKFSNSMTKTLLCMTSTKVMLSLFAILGFILSIVFLYMTHIDFDAVVTKYYVYGSEVAFDVQRTDVNSDEYLETVIKETKDGNIYILNKKAFEELLKINKIPLEKMKKSEPVACVYTVNREPFNQKRADVGIDGKKKTYSVLGEVEIMPFKRDYSKAGYNFVILDNEYKADVISRLDALDGSLDILDKYDALTRQEAIQKQRNFQKPIWIVYVVGSTLISFIIFMLSMKILNQDVLYLIKTYEQLILMGLKTQIKKKIIKQICIIYASVLFFSSFIGYIILSINNINQRIINPLEMLIIPSIMTLIIFLRYNRAFNKNIKRLLII